MRHFMQPGWSRPATVCFLLVALLPATVAAAGKYTVQPGDSLQAIARKELGDAERWREIARRNNLKTPYMIKPGQILTMPDRTPRPRPLVENRPTDSPPDVKPDVQKSSPPSSRLDLSGTAIVIIVIGVAFWWLFTTVCLRVACWFSLVETSLRRCAWLALFLLVVSGVCVGGWVVTARVDLPERSLPASVGIILGLLVVYLVGGLLVTRWTLRCKWRSVLTVLVMSSFLANLITAGLWILVGLLIPAVGAATLLPSML